MWKRATSWCRSPWADLWSYLRDRVMWKVILVPTGSTALQISPAQTATVSAAAAEETVSSPSAENLGRRSGIKADPHSGPLLASRTALLHLIMAAVIQVLKSERAGQEAKCLAPAACQKCTPDCQETEFTLKNDSGGWKGLLAASNG